MDARMERRVDESLNEDDESDWKKYIESEQKEEKTKKNEND